MENPLRPDAQRRTFDHKAVPAMRKAIARIVAETPVTDLHTHLFAPAFRELLLYGVDELITYHYLIAEALRVSETPPDTFYAMPKQAQADLIWQELFVKRSPISESCRGVLTVLNRLGLDTSARDLTAYRAYFDEADLEAHLDKVFEAAGVSCVVHDKRPLRWCRTARLGSWVLGG